ncbi:MAG: tripartite tricarboxylate transporter TctB family protein [Thermodesulfobacteriota bacterium]
MEVARRDFFSTFFWLIFAICISIESYRLGLGTWSAPGPGYFPFGAGILLGLISLSILIKSLLRLPLRKKPSNVIHLEERPNWQRVILALTGMLFYVFLFYRLGFVLSTFLLIAFFVWVIGRRSWFVSFIAALLTTAASYLLFEILLDAQLPKGILERFL